MLTLDNVEIYYNPEAEAEEHAAAGWYFGAGAPGCLYDIGPEGPYPTEEDARAAACEALGVCEHGTPEDAPDCADCPAPTLYVIREADGRALAFSMGPAERAAAWVAEAPAQSTLDRMRAAGLIHAGARVERLADADARAWGNTRSRAAEALRETARALDFAREALAAAVNAWPDAGPLFERLAGERVSAQCSASAARRAADAAERG